MTPNSELDRVFGGEDGFSPIQFGERRKRCDHGGAPCPFNYGQRIEEEPPITVVRFLSMFAVALLMWLAIIALIVAMAR